MPSETPVMDIKQKKVTMNVNNENKQDEGRRWWRTRRTGETVVEGAGFYVCCVAQKRMGKCGQRRVSLCVCLVCEWPLWAIAKATKQNKGEAR